MAPIGFSENLKGSRLVKSLRRGVFRDEIVSNAFIVRKINFNRVASNCFCLFDFRIERSKNVDKLC